MKRWITHAVTATIFIVVGTISIVLGALGGVVWEWIAHGGYVIILQNLPVIIGIPILVALGAAIHFSAKQYALVTKEYFPRLKNSARVFLRRIQRHRGQRKLLKLMYPR